MFKKSLQFLLLLMALMAPWAMKGQTLTVYRGDDASTYVPVIGYYTDNYGKCEFVMSADSLTDMNSKVISKMKFNITAIGSYGTGWNTGTFQVFMKEINATTISAYQGTTDATIVYEGVFANPAVGDYEITFTNEYEYQGGNLLIGIYRTEKGNYKDATFKGKSVTGASLANYSSSSLASVSATQRNFVPKTTFTYHEPPTCPKPTNLHANLTEGNGTIATLVWTEKGTASNWEVIYGTDPTLETHFAPITTGFNVDGSTISCNLTGLTAETAHYAKVKAVCEAGVDESEYTNIMKFTPSNFYTKTVNNGTSTNSYVPLYYYYVANSSYYTQSASQFIIPADSISTLQWGKISKLTFYNSETTVNYNSAQFAIYVGEVDVTTQSSYTNWNTLTNVYTGTLNVSDNKMEITFSGSFTYQGGNLLIGMKISTKGTSQPSSNNWYGKSATSGASLYTTYSISSCNKSSFLPKVTFSYLEGEAPSCLPVSNLSYSNEQATSVDLNWTAGGSKETAWKLQYKKTTEEEWTTYPSAITEKPFTLPNLSELTTYQWQVAAWCDTSDPDGISDYVAGTNFTTKQTAVAVGDSWSDNFEGESCGWQLINGDCADIWVWGTATNNGGTHALYISDDNGTTNHYSHNTVKVFAAKLFTFTNDGKFTFAYDWKAKGESSCDFLRVALVPSDKTLTAGSDYSSVTYNSLPTDWIAIDGGGKLNLVESWQTKEATINVTAGSYYVVFIWRSDTSTQIQDPAAVDNFSITRVACGYDVDGLEVATEPAPTAHTATINWTDSEATQWQVAWSKDNTFAPANTQTETVSANTINLVNLDASSTYYVKVRAYCGGEDYGAWCNAIECPTECEAISSFPWSYNFNSDATGNFSKQCWVNDIVSGSYKFKVSSSTNGSNSTNQLYMDYHSGSVAKLVLPELAIPTGKTYQFVVDVYRTAASESYNDGIGVYANTTSSLDNATQLGFLYRVRSKTDGNIVTAETTTGWYTYAFDLPYNGSCFVILKGEGQGGNSTYVDNFVIRQAPDCDTPTGLAVTANSQTPEGATITWKAGDASSWIVEYKASTEENYTAIAEPVNDTTYTFTGLNYSTTYNVRVKVNCTEGSGVSYPTEPVNFTTNVQFPAPTNFETSNLTHNSVTLAWTAGYTNQTAWKVQYKKSSDSWTDAATIVNAPTIDITELVANTAYDVRIYGGIGENFGTDYLSGDFTTKNPNAAPTDFVVSNLTASSATISWTPGYTTQDHWTVEYKKSSEEWDAATTENATSPTINLDNLDGLTTYNVRIYYVEDYKLIGNFTTAAGLPFTQAFASSSIPANWEQKSGVLANVLAGTESLSSGSGWYFGTSNSVFNSHAYTNVYGSSCKRWLVTPNIVLGNNDCSLKFMVAFTKYSGDQQQQTSIGDNDMFAVVLSADNGNSWTLLDSWDKDGTNKLSDLSYTDGDNITIDLSTYKNQTIKIAFYAQATDTDHDSNLHIDDVEVDINQDCDKPVLTLDDKTDTTADFSWTDGDGTTTWTLNYKKTADEDWTAVNAIATNSYQIPNLEAETSYDVRVLASCNIYWSNTVTFETASACETPDGLAASNVTASSASISWNTYGQTVFNLRYGTDGENWTVKNSVSTPCSLTDLSGAKVYKVQVQAACNTEVWSTTLEFQTPFEVTEISTFFEDFEGYTGATYSATGVVPDCWSSYKGGAYYYPHIISQGTYNYATSGNVLALSGGSYSPYYSYVALPLFSNDLDELQITFKWATYSESYGTLALGYIKETDNGQFNTFTVIKSYSASTSSYRALIQADAVYLNELPADAYRLAFRWYGSTSSYYFCNIDDVEVSLIPSCWPVTLGENTTAAHTATLNWTAGHDETAWNIRWREEGSTGAYSTATATTTTYTITSGLQANTTYEYGVQADCGNDDESEWVSDTFTTKCDATNVDKEHPFFEGFEGDVFPPDCWTRGNTYSSGTTDYWNSSTAHPYNNSSKSAYSYYYGPIELYTPALNITGNANAAYLTFWSYNTYPSSYDKNSVLISVDGAAFTQIWSPDSVSQSWVPTTIDLTSYIGHDIVIGFKYEGNNAHGWYLDDVAVTVYDIVFPSEGTWASTNFEPAGAPTTSDDVIIQANVTVTNGTNAEANNINIQPGAVITVESGATLTIAGEVTGGTAASIVIQHGGQLIHPNPVEATQQNSVSAAPSWTSNEGGGWYFIASPVDGAVIEESIQVEPFDLYKYDEPDAMWYAYNGDGAPFTTMERGIGYLHASKEDQILAFAGEMIGTETEITKPLSFTSSLSADVKGYNLMGNPYTRVLEYGDITLGGESVTSFLSLTDDGEEYLACNLQDDDTIRPCQGFFIQATAENQNLVFNPAKKDKSEIGLISIKAGNEEFMDKAYIQIGGGNTLRKMAFSDNNMVYVMDGDDDYSAMTIYELANPIPVHFVAAEPGTYTITVNAKNIDLDYMHLVDEFTNEHIDLLSEPTYTFTSAEGDKPGRFTIVFGIDNVEENLVNDIFAYQYEDELVVDGNGMLQIFDVLGRFVGSHEVHGSERISLSSFNTGVYVLRMVGENVKTQKIVVR